MWDCCCESVKKVEKSSGSGCILAHCMGLGKTLQVKIPFINVELSFSLHFLKLLNVILLLNCRWWHFFIRCCSVKNSISPQLWWFVL